MKPSTLRAAVAGAVVVLFSLVGCGGDSGEDSGAASSAPESTASSTEDYCSSLEDAKAEFESFGQAGSAGFEESLSTLRGIAEQAPEEVAPQWETMVGFLDGFEQAVTDAGLTLEQLEQIQQNPQSLPEGVDPAKLQELITTVQGLGAAEVEQASKAINKHAKAECGITLDEPTG